ncbi:hypothetical protein [Maribacter sp. 2307UL18-2]|uniref:hypothetical protein n=1 Tax=Maribacter sp. 2307UL18-2 TaxID=3386274 RepID=UPI0039BC7B2C
MKSVWVTLFIILGMSCKEAPESTKTEKTATKEVVKEEISPYPEALKKVFDAHGGIDTWKSKQLLSFDILKGDQTEKHTIALYSRDEKIEMPGISMGSQGDDIWLLDAEGMYKGDPVFYHNLMFYFYAMPFVFADEGIFYKDAEPLEFEGKRYPGIRIAYEDGVGLSAKDEYFLHYDPDTFQMVWLGYTVTFKSGEKSDNVRWIRYNDRMTVDGLLVPKSLTWYEYEGRTIKDARDPLVFDNVSFDEVSPSTDFFSKPEGAKIMN